jgi:amylosucrase
MDAFYPLTPEANAKFAKLKPTVRDRLTGRLPEHESNLFLLRLQRHFQDLYDGLVAVYGPRDDFDAFLERLVASMAEQYRACPVHLRARHAESLIWPDWHQHESMVGYIAYADRFAGGLQAIEAHLDYLVELGVTYLHLMPFTQAPRGRE